MDLLAPVPEEFLRQHVPGEKGGMVLVDHEEMHRILTQLEIAPGYSTGGSAANATFNATRLGLRTAFLGKLGDDELAHNYRTVFQRTGVDTSRFKSGPLPNARSLILVTPDAQRTMRTCLAAAMTLAPDEISMADFAGCRHAHIEGYLVFNEVLINAVLASARAAGCSVSLDLASFEVINVTRNWIFSQLHKGIDVVFANEDEIRALFQDTTSDYPTLARRLASYGVIAAVKVGRDGAWIAEGENLHRINPVIVSDVIDTNGAGDIFHGAYMYSYLTTPEKSWESHFHFARAASAHSVRYLGIENSLPTRADVRAAEKAFREAA